MSWAVPKGPTLDPKIRRMAVHVEDHPIEYFDFEGVIPAKQYGAGDVIVWDWGTWEPEAPTLDATTAIPNGELKFLLHGEKLKGRFTIVRTSRRPGSAPSRAFEDDEGEQWLLIHKRDEAAQDGWDAEDHPQSVKTGRTNDDVKADRDALWNGQAPAAERGDRPRRRRRRADAAAHRSDARHARQQAVQRPRLAVRDQVGRLPRAGGRRRRQGPDLDAQPQRRRDLLPEAAEPADLDRRQPGDRRWRGRGARRGRPAGLLPAPDQARREVDQRARLPGVRPALPRRAVAPRRPARGSQAAAAERAEGASARPVRGARRGRGRGVLRGRAGQRGRGHRRQAPPVALRAGPPDECLAEAQDPAGAGARGRRLDAGGGECARPRGAGGRRVRGRQAAVQRQGRVRVHGRDPQGPPREPAAAGDGRRRRSTRRRPRTTAAAGAATWRTSRGSGRSS